MKTLIGSRGSFDGFCECELGIVCWLENGDGHLLPCGCSFWTLWTIWHLVSKQKRPDETPASVHPWGLKWVGTWANQRALSVWGTHTAEGTWLWALRASQELSSSKKPVKTTRLTFAPPRKETLLHINCREIASLRCWGSVDVSPN